MENETDPLDELFQDTFEYMEKPFNEVFSIVNSHGELKLIPLISSDIEGIKLDVEKLIVSPTITINGVYLHSLQDKILVGKLHKYSNIFYIESWKV